MSDPKASPKVLPDPGPPVPIPVPIGDVTPAGLAAKVAADFRAIHKAAQLSGVGAEAFLFDIHPRFALWYAAQGLDVQAAICAKWLTLKAASDIAHEDPRGNNNYAYRFRLLQWCADAYGYQFTV